MAADDLGAPLGQRRKKKSALRLPLAQIAAAVLAIFPVAFVVWALIGDDPFGGQPVAVAPIPLQGDAPAKTTAASDQPGKGGGLAEPTPHDGNGQGQGQGPANPKKEAAAPGTTTVNIINGTTGARQEVTIPASGSAVSPANSPGVDPKLLEITPQGAIPKISADGVRPADAFAQPVKLPPGNPDAPRVALIVGGLGVSAKATAEAISLPGAVTLAFIPYGANGAAVALARSHSHEVLLEVPMEPYDYPDNDSGPQTLLTSLTQQQNADRLHWIMSRFQGYVGLINMMGARFTASEQAFAPVLRETAKRGLIYVDDGSNLRSVAGRISGANNLPFVKADVVVDSVPAADEVDRALARLEMTAREHHVAVGIASALPVSIAHIAKWAKAAAKRGVLLVPITAVALKDKQS
ncbi:MAG: divergent polysaccharide deacetylase family protein [Xanthobacteraceae bacterium]